MGRHKIISDEKMLEGARECFLEFGPSVSTEVIADRLGVSQATLFKRFHAKEDLMIAALVPTSHPDWIDMLAQGPDDRNLHVQLLEIATRLNTFIEQIFPRIAVLMVSGFDHKRCFSGEQAPPLVTIITQLATWFRKAHKKGLIRKIHADATAYALVGALHSRVLVQSFSSGSLVPVSGKVHIDNFVETLLIGITEGGKR
jgi:AcrR family transcriptional regulator